MKKFFKHQKITDRLYLVRESYWRPIGFHIGLVIGEQYAAVIDSGLGAVDGLGDYIEMLTDKPLICIVTHGHPDHVGGANLFDRVLMNQKDEKELAWALSEKRRLSDLRIFSKGNVEVMEYAQKHIVSKDEFHYENISDGDQINLGGNVLDIYEMCGHSKGSIAVVNKREQYIFTGDAVSNTVVITEADRDVLLEYERALHRLIVLCKKMPKLKLYGTHESQPMSYELLLDLKDATRELIDGEVKEDKSARFLFASENDPTLRLRKHITRNAQIIYNELLIS